jgi:hypothetical protein
LRWSHVRGAEPLPGYRRAWLDDAVSACLGACNVAIAPDATEWRTPIPSGPLELHVSGRTDDFLFFEGEHEGVTRIAVQFDRRKRVIAKSHVYYYALWGGNISSHNGSRDLASELLDGSANAPAP